MSWLVDIAGKAEDFLNKIDKNAAVALHTSTKQEKESRPKKTEPFLEPSAPTHPSTITEQFTGPSHSIENTSLNNSGSSNIRRNTKRQNPPNKILASSTTNTTESSNTSSSSNNANFKRKDDVTSSTKTTTNSHNGTEKKKTVTINKSQTTATEDELMAYLNSNESTGLNESLILKDEVESQARELKLLTKNHRSLQKEYEEVKKKLEIYKDKLANEESNRHTNQVEEGDARKFLEEKDAEIRSLTSRHQQALETLQKLELSQENLQKLEQCLLENSQLKSENESLLKRTEMLASQLETTENHVLSMKSTLSSMEKEFTNYKEKAKSILSYKDELIASLKNEDSSTLRNDTSSNSAEELFAEVTTLKNERELLQADLSQTRASVESLKEDNVRLEKEVSSLRCFTEDLNVQLSREKESVGSLQSENLQVCQQLSSLQFQLEMEKAARKKFEDQVNKAREYSNFNINGSDSFSQNGHLNAASEKELSRLKTRVNALSQSLYEKQSLINDISTDKQLLQIEVERLKHELRDCRVEDNDLCHGNVLPQTVIASQPLYLSESPWDSRVSARMKRMYTQIDAVFCQFGLALRKRPNLRLGMSLYIVVLHLWVFFVLFSWMHHATPGPESNNRTENVERKLEIMGYSPTMAEFQSRINISIFPSHDIR